jgi:hypothetical protein
VSRPALGSIQPLYNGYRGSFPRGKARPGRDADHPHLVARSRMSRSYICSPPWRVAGLLYLTNRYEVGMFTYVRGLCRVKNNCNTKNYKGWNVMSPALHAGAKAERCVAPIHTWPRHCEWIASRPGSALLPGKDHSYPLDGWASQLIWTHRIEAKSFASAGDRTPVVLTDSKWKQRRFRTRVCLISFFSYHSFQANSGRVLEIRPRPLPSRSFTISSLTSHVFVGRYIVWVAGGTIHLCNE